MEGTIQEICRLMARYSRVVREYVLGGLTWGAVGRGLHLLGPQADTHTPRLWLPEGKTAS